MYALKTKTFLMFSFEDIIKIKVKKTSVKV